ncbi:pentatricopeptide repeat-containing protein At2g35030, mitochondrial-like [Selaginella moellendorffii]|uniref:pentatricopeptide repeat-containing protein At2g35030, mitochondrial-like n=1 Tax=Selaginella moellendorffii TaxID=88036 RepID=UPI000D1D06F5|nr:pentatricopeptide repeat-containing protein At2g35030, mitochondrial-like [Selaginella moellendorffii]|eukprot:XP_024525827.1 pentatricopeptide repeat-containing protein At2g35030, mitochondrial-like [Selaginella moellendorffii]
MASQSKVELKKELALIIKQCGISKQDSSLRKLNAHISDDNGRIFNTFLGNLLVQAFGRCGDLSSARRVFDKICFTNVFSWNIMIAAYAQSGHLDEAQVLFEKAVAKNATTWNTMITAYSQQGDVKKAKSLFDRMSCKDSISWNSLLSTYARNGHGERALAIFKLMDLEGFPPTELTFLVIVDVCANYVAKRDGRIIHSCIQSHGLQTKVMVATALLNMHAKFGDVETAKHMFDTMPEKNEISWNAMLAAYSQNGYLHEALDLFQRIQNRDVVSWNTLIGAYASHGLKREALTAFMEMESKFSIAPNVVTFVSLLGGVNFDLAEVKSIHARIVSSELRSEMKVATALLESYARCGSLVDARKIFDSIPRSDTILWNVMLASYSSLGDSKQAIYLFRMMSIEGLMPNDLTFTVILSVCSHAGLLRNSLEFFSFMINGCEIKASEEHYHCLSDLFGRVGWVSEARDLFKQLPDNVAWTSLVAACKIHGNITKT